MYTPLEKLGLLFLVYVIYKVGRKILSTLFFYFAAPALNLGVDLKSQGQWAVVTGATDGIGKAYAEALAKKGLDIVLISRTKSKLENVASEIKNTYKVNTKIIEADFTKGDEVYALIEKELYGLEIGVLINNVGHAYAYPEYYLAVENMSETYRSIIACNVVTVIKMCEIVLPGMVQQHKGVVVNVSSISSLCPVPLYTVYGATKVFINKFSEDLASEYESKGLIIQTIVPGYVTTKLSKYSRPQYLIPTPAKYVESAIKTIGVQKLAIGYYPHFLMLVCVQILQGFSHSLAANLILKALEKRRKIILKKMNTKTQTAPVLAEGT